MSDGVTKLDDDGSGEPHLRTRGRTRICKLCKFTCTDSKEFLNHQQGTHSQERDPDLLASLGTRRKSQNSLNIKKVLTRSSSASDVASSLSDKSFSRKKLENNLNKVTKKDRRLSDPVKTVRLHTTNIDCEELEKDASDLVSESDDKQSESDRLISLDSKVTSQDISGSDMDDENEQSYILTPEGEDQDEEGRLIIAEDDMPKTIQQPTRSGNIQNRTYVCNLCEFSSTSAKIFLHHQKDKHKLDITIYECDICEYATKYKQKLPRHRKLHFTGRENGLLSGSDLDSSFGDKSFGQLDDRERDISDLGDPNMVGDPSMVDDDDEDEGEEDDDEEGTVVVQPEQVIETIPGEKKKRKTRQEVDPAKYFEVLDDTGIKYACSNCGNVYKWRKSLNKHWKEKHFGDIPDLTRPPPGLNKLNTVSHVKYRMSNSMGVDSSRMSVSPSSGSHKGNRSATATPQNIRCYTPQGESQDDGMNSVASSHVVMPKFIGPFITNTSIYPANAPPSLIKSEVVNGEGGSDAKSSTNRKSEQPIDFSVGRKELDVNRNRLNGRDELKIKGEPQWNEYSEETNGLDNEIQEEKKGEPNPILQCSRCGFVAKTLVDYSSHMTLHLNKRAFKCAECQEHFNGIDDLNKHFAEKHSEKIHEHKEAIQKIPHGLQQTYHLLKMPLNAIGSMSTQDVGGSEPKYLKCSMCNFVAKWPAELQKHAVSHSEERPFICMVCGSTYKWKWDLVKHFEKSHNTLPNPYKRREQGGLAGPSVTNGKINSTESRIASNSLYELTSEQSMSTTAAALLDAGQHTFRKLSHNGTNDDDPPKKKRRLSDTDVGMMETEQNEEHENHKGYILAGSLDLSTPDRPSSEPSANSSQDILMMENSNHNLKSSSALHDIKSLIPFDDEEIEMSVLEKFGISKDQPLTQDTQQAILNAVKKRLESGKLISSKDPSKDSIKQNIANDILLPYKCSLCEYRARWPSEITQHMKNHSDEKPYHCPRCSYKSKWKWDVVKHLKRCGGGTIRDVIDTNKIKKMPPPNVTVMPQGMFQQETPQPVNYMMGQSLQDDESGGKMLYGSTDINMNSYQDYEDENDDSEGEDSDSNRPTQPVFRSLINQGLYHCLECPFVGHSPAELKRHSVLHSENKPFTCTICGYSSRWKCDLKKHMRVYGHYDPLAKQKTMSGALPQMFLQDKFKLNSVPSDNVENDADRQLFQCDNCPYVTYKKSSFDAHIKIHGDSKKDEGSSSKFKCKQCDFQVEDLLSFIQHKKTHSSGAANTSQTSPSSNQEQNLDQVSNRTLQKHRRKPVQQFKCSKCPYTCFKRSGLTLHEEMHKPRSEAFVCLYCDYNVYSKSLLLQHMRLHPEFDISECHEILNDEDDEINSTEEFDGMEESQQNEDNEHSRMAEEEDSEDYKEKHQASNSNQAKLDSNYAAGYAQGLYQSRISNQNQSEGLDLSAGALDLSKMTSSSSPQPASIYGRNANNRFPCEWCSEMFPNLVAVLKHARTVHPLELRKQELGETSMSLPTQPPVHNAEILKSKLIEQAQNMFAAQQQAMNKQIAHQQKPQAHHQQQQQQQQQQPVTFHSKLFDQSFTQHQRYRPIEPKPLQTKSGINIPSSSSSSSISAIKKLQDMSAATSAIKNTPSSSSNSLSSSSGKSPSQLAGQLILQQLRAKKSTSPHKRGRSFQCTKCSFTAPNAVTYLRHIERHGSNCRHTCRFCDYSIDRLNLLYQHMKGTHSDLWRGTPEEKINLTSNNSNRNNDDKSMRLYTQEMSDNPNNSYDTMSLNESMLQEEGFDFSRGGEDSLNSSSSSEYKAIMGSLDREKQNIVLKEATTWRGIPVQVCTINGRKNYKCPKCLYVSSNAANTTNHVRQHGSNRKYRCDKCDYSVDNLKLIYHHMESVHPKEPGVGDKNGGKLPFSVEVDYFPEENNNSLMWDEENFSRMSENAGNYESCTKCPFRCKSIENLQRHIEMHEYNGKLQCEYCDFSVDSQTQLIEHLVVHREPYEPELEDDEEEEMMKIYKESMNNNKQEQKEIMDHSGNQHIQSMAGDVKLTAQSLKNILNRMKKNGERLRYCCATCPYFSFCKNNIVKHRKQHLVKSQYTCQKCDYSATRAYLLQQHMKFHKSQDDGEFKGTFLDITLDPYDKEGAKLLRSVETSEKVDDKVKENAEEEKDFSDETSEEIENLEGDGEDEFDEDEMADLERAEFECLGSSKNKTVQEVDNTSNASDDSLSEMDPTALQQQITLNMSGTLSLPGEKIRYTCSLCPYKCNALRSFKCHIHMHGLNKKYICDHCNWSADRLNLLYQHRKVHAQELGFVLSPEDIVFLNRDFALENDGKFAGIHMEVNDLQMKKTLNNDDEKGDANEQRRMGNKNFTGKKIYACKQCPFSCNNKNSFAYHKNLHRITARYTCSECSYSVDRWNLLTQHLRLHQQEGGFKGGRNRLKCQKCPFASPTIEILEEHTKLHGAGKEFVCRYCDFSVEKQSFVIQHQKVHLTAETDCSSPHASMNEMKNFDPSSPDVVAPQLYFNSPEDINEDSMESQEEKSRDLKCDRCPYGTPSKEELKDHEHQHNVHYKQSCPYCDFSCPEKHDLVDHIQLHLPSTKVTLDLVKSIQEKQSKHGEKALEAPEVPVVRGNKVPEAEQNGEPDSTTPGSSNQPNKDDTVTKPKHEPGEPILDVKEALKTLKEKEPKSKTKVYVCQYCEREFEGKTLMLQHERQHLIGTKY